MTSFSHDEIALFLLKKLIFSPFFIYLFKKPKKKRQEINYLVQNSISTQRFKFRSMEQEVRDRWDENREHCGEGGWTGIAVVPIASVALSSSTLSLALSHELGASNQSVSRIIATFCGLLELLWIVDFTVELHTSVDISRADLCEDTWNAVLHEAGCGFSG